MIPELRETWRRWDETHAALLDCLEQFPAQAFEWRPAPNATTASEIVIHIARAELGYSLRVAGRVVERPEYRVRNRAEALEVVNAAADQASRIVDCLRIQDLGRVVAEEWYPLGPRVEGPLTVEWFIEQMVRHKAYHLGQLWYLSMMLEGA